MYTKYCIYVIFIYNEIEKNTLDSKNNLDSSIHSSNKLRGYQLSLAASKTNCD